MGIFRHKQEVRKVVEDKVRFNICTNYELIKRPEKRRILAAGGKQYYLNVKVVESAPLLFCLTLTNVENKNSELIITKDFGDFLHFDIHGPIVGYINDIIMPRYVAYLDTKKYKRILECLMDNNICEIYKPLELSFTGINGHPGHTNELTVDGYTYPIVQVNFSELAKYDYDGMVAYEDAYNKELKRLSTMTMSEIKQECKGANTLV